jgi:hypothetical protein
MVQLLFARLPQFKDDTISIKQIKDLTTTKQQINRKIRFLIFLVFFIQFLYSLETVETNLTYVSLK